MTGRLVAFAMVAFVGVAGADNKPGKNDPKGSGAPPVEEPPAPEVAPEPPGLVGPRLVDLGNNSEIDLPAGTRLIERAEAQKLLEKGGDDSRNVVALIGKDDASWLVIIDYDGIGFVSDDDADQLQSNELLESYKEGTLHQNEKRRSLGVDELFVDSWSEIPRYDRSKRQLVWGINAHTSKGEKVINFMTRILGRNGFLSVNLIDTPERIEASKKEALAILTATRFRAGFRHEDHKEGDRDSGVGLTGLILGGGGVALAAKTGLLLKILLVLKKGFLFIVLGIGAIFGKLFGRKRRGAEAEAVASSETPPATPEDKPPAVEATPPKPPNEHPPGDPPPNG
jgi:uncharacterized membrane-anchored protein